MKSIGAISSLFTLPSKEVWNIENGLNWAYNQTLRTDMPCGLCNALELADEYRMNYSSIMEASDKLIKDQLLKIGGTGLLISLGTLFNPVGIPVSMGISWMLQLRLIFCGAVGNIIDSVFYGMIFSDSYSQVATLFPHGGGYSSFLHGKVVDMLYFPLYEGFLPQWIPIWGGDFFVFFRPVFNLADSYITIGVFILFLFHRKFFASKK